MKERNTSMCDGKYFRGAAASLAGIACLGMLIPAPRSFASETAKTRTSASHLPRFHVADVALEPGGVLRGHVVDAHGIPQGNQYVELWNDGRAVKSTHTDSRGWFLFAKVRGGVYQTVAAGNIGLVRAWSPKTAPPGADGQIMIVTGDVARGQIQPMASLISNPWMIAAIFTAAVTIPVAIHNHRNDRLPASGN
jgi:hypothetical protein